MKPITQYEETLQAYLQAFHMSSLDYPACPSDSLILHTFITVYLGPPHLPYSDAVTLSNATATLSQQYYHNFSATWCISTFLQRSLHVSMQCFQANRLDMRENCMAPTFTTSKPLDFRTWKFMEDVVYIPLMSTALCELQQHIKGAANLVD